MTFPAESVFRFEGTNDLGDGTAFRSMKIEGGGYRLDGNGLKLGEGGLLIESGNHTLSASYEWIADPLCLVRPGECRSQRRRIGAICSDRPFVGLRPIGQRLHLLSRSIALSAWLDGGEGNDWLTGGAGHDVLLGASGTDLLIGGAGRDLVGGGEGSGGAYGGNGDDILIAGQLNFVDPTGALAAIMAEWTSSRGNAMRIDNLLGDSASSTPDRANGDSFLTPGGTVLDDANHDAPWGGLSRYDEDDEDSSRTVDRDWYFADTTTYGGCWFPEDVVI